MNGNQHDREFVTIRRDEHEALRLIADKAQNVCSGRTGGGSWIDQLDELCMALGAWYRLIPARRPAGTPPKERG